MIRLRPIHRARWAADSVREYVRLQRLLKIGSKEWVLDVGSGSNPFPRANVLCDRHPEPTVHRHWTSLITDRPTVIADVTRLPFADRAFDVVVCSHVLEHVDDPAAAIEELQRVGRRGYIECPSASWEKVAGFPFHRWLVSDDRGTLVFREKPGPDFDPELRQWFRDFLVRLGIDGTVWLQRRRLGAYVALVWRDEIPFRVIRRTESGWGGEPHPAGTPSPPEASAGGLGVTRRAIEVHGRRARFRSNRPPDALYAVLRCPRCGSTLGSRQARLTCVRCGAEFPVGGEDRPLLLAEPG